MTSWLSISRRNQPHRLSTRIAISVAVSAAAIGAFAIVTANGTDRTYDAAGGSATDTQGAVTRSITDTQISTFAYTLTKQAKGRVDVTIHPAAVMDLALMQADLATLGINATVTKLGDLPDTRRREYIKVSKQHGVIGSTTRDANGEFHAIIVRGKPELLVFKTKSDDTGWVLIKVEPSK
jgi:hypothetical protein